MPRVINPNKPETFNQESTYYPMTKLTTNIINYLINYNNVIWNLLYYNENSALYKPALTSSQKGSIIYDGHSSIDEASKFNTYKIFQQDGINDGSDVQQSRLYIHVLEIKPTTSIYGQVDIAFDVIVNNQLAILNTLENRGEVIIAELIQTLNGAYMGGITNFEFNKKNIGNRVSPFAQKWYSGLRLVMSCKTT
jgi:hypothetical protein